MPESKHDRLPLSSKVFEVILPAGLGIACWSFIAFTVPMGWVPLYFLAVTLIGGVVAISAIVRWGNTRTDTEAAAANAIHGVLIAAFGLLYFQQGGTFSVLVLVSWISLYLLAIAWLVRVSEVRKKAAGSPVVRRDSWSDPKGPPNGGNAMPDNRVRKAPLRMRLVDQYLPVGVAAALWVFFALTRPMGAELVFLASVLLGGATTVSAILRWRHSRLGTQEAVAEAALGGIITSFGLLFFLSHENGAMSVALNLLLTLLLLVTIAWRVRISPDAKAG